MLETPVVHPRRQVTVVTEDDDLVPGALQGAGQVHGVQLTSPQLHAVGVDQDPHAVRSHGRV